MNPESLIFILSRATLLLQAAIAGTTLLYIAQRFTGFDYRNYSWLEKLYDRTRARHLELAFILSLVATFGSLYMSNILGWTPCHLCWFQRIFMYPLALLTATALLLEKKDVHEYVLPMVMIGGSISIYHYSVQIFSKVTSGCSTLAVSCSDKFTYYFGYMTIPMFALTAFVAIGLLLWKFRD
ncbi:disulfide bond formation protein B [Candidatus Nanohaloarchaea archaeon]|nr:disulfide bond formation protein B [Candidatus Nanohaloarchaea archaeon]